MGVGYATSRAAAQSEGTMSSEHFLLPSESFKNVFSEALLGVPEKRQETAVISNSNPLISLVLLSHREFFVSDTRLVESAAGWSR